MKLAFVFLAVTVPLFATGTHAETSIYDLRVSDCKVVKAASIEVEMILNQLNKKSDKTPAYNKAIDAWVKNHMLNRIVAYSFILGTTYRHEKDSYLNKVRLSTKDRNLATFAEYLSIFSNPFHAFPEQGITSEVPNIDAGKIVLNQSKKILSWYCDRDVRPYGKDFDYVIKENEARPTKEFELSSEM